VTASLLSALRDQFGARYAIEREIGRGGMGAVYLARDRTLDRPVALKVLPPEIATDAGLRERFLRETRLVAGFSHPNIVPVFAVEESPTLLAFAMGYIEGESLTTRVQRAGPLTSREAVRLLQDIGYALAYAHGRGIVHRDLKPDNIMIERATGRALLMDFGIARSIDAPVATNGVTRVGEVVGTPEFMSPEQASGDVVDGRSDLYALALVAYFALTGTLAISGESMQRVVVAQLTQPVPSVGALRGDLPPALVAVIDRCAAKEPSARFASAEALVEALDAAQLAAPEVAIPVREFARELDALPVVLFVGFVVIKLLLDLNEARDWHPADGLRAMTVVIALLLARGIQVVNARRRLSALGFDGASLFAGLAQLLEERSAYAAALRAKPGFARRQRLIFWTGVLMIPGSIMLRRIATAARTEVAPMTYIMPEWASALLYVNAAMWGAALVLIVRSPVLSLRDRAFRALWLGPIGRVVLGLSRTPDTGRTVPPTGDLLTRASPSLPSGAALTEAASSPPPPAYLHEGTTADKRSAELTELRAALRTLDAHVRALEARASAASLSLPHDS
jgi:eukaryotic-like serine/threonine-protein kinase